MIHCTNCGHVNAEGASQCEACYDTLPALTSCATCQTSVPDDAFFCPQCGASLPRGVSQQGDASPGASDEPALSKPPAFNELPPTNVVAQQALGAPPVPPTDVVSFAGSADLPPTNVVNPISSPSDLPPTNVVNAPPADLPPTNVVNVPPADLPPTNVVNPANFGTPLPPPDIADSNPPPYVAETIPPQAPPAYAAEPEPVDDIETVPTMVVSPGSNRDVIEPPSVHPVPPEPSEPPIVPPTMPPQSPLAYQVPPAVEPISLETPPSVAPPAIEPPPAPAVPPLSGEQGSEPPPSFDVPAATTVQPHPPSSIPSVGETLIQLPSVYLMHERSDARITLPNQEVILIGKTTDTIMPDVDVSSFVDSDVVSRRHAVIFMEADGYFLEDLGSSNGTYVNDEPCEQGDRVPIQSGDRICLGRENKVAFIFQIG